MTPSLQKTPNRLAVKTTATVSQLKRTMHSLTHPHLPSQGATNEHQRTTLRPYYHLTPRISLPGPIFLPIHSLIHPNSLTYLNTELPAPTSSPPLHPYHHLSPRTSLQGPTFPSIHSLILSNSTTYPTTQPPTHTSVTPLRPYHHLIPRITSPGLTLTTTEY